VVRVHPAVPAKPLQSLMIKGTVSALKSRQGSWRFQIGPKNFFVDSAAAG
jgi:hypothetical protein